MRSFVLVKVVVENVSFGPSLEDYLFIFLMSFFLFLHFTHYMFSVYECLKATHCGEFIQGEYLMGSIDEQEMVNSNC